MTWVQTQSGIAFDLLNPKEEMVNVFDIVTSLSKINRFMGHTRFPISVADHSIRVALIISRWGGTSHEIRCGLAHDFAEAYIGDISSPLKGLIPSLREIEQRVWGAIADRFSLPMDLPSVVKDADIQALHDEHITTQAEAPKSWEIPGFEYMDVCIEPRSSSPEIDARRLREHMDMWGLT